jgi:voltage-gated potassium channel Kch
MPKLTLRARVRARFDRTMDRGMPALVAWLMLASAALIVLFAALSELVPGGYAGSWLHALWETFLSTVDSGQIGGISNYNHLFLLTMLASTVAGIFVVSTLIGVLATGVANQVAELRKGRSPVLLKGHAVILGWSDQIFTIVSELANANEGRRSYVVILANEDKVVMEDNIRARLPHLRHIRVICRTGSPLKPSDLEIVNLDSARSITVLSPADASADIQVIKALLLLRYRSWTGPRRPHVVAAVQDSHNYPAAVLAGGEYAQIIDADDIAVRLVVQSHRQSGLSTVCTDLLDFSGNEIYMTPTPSLAGRTFGEALNAFDKASPIGIYAGATDTIAINPDMGRVLEPRDELIVIAEHRKDTRPSTSAAPVHEAAVVTTHEVADGPDATLLIGWNSRAPKIIQLLDDLVGYGSRVDIAATPQPDFPLGPRANLVVGYKECDPTSRPSLESIGLAGYRHIVVLSDDGVDPAHADDRALVTLLHLREFEAQFGDQYSIVTEMNDDANREVAQVAAADDFIVSNRLISLLMTQLAENYRLQGVFKDLFDPRGSEIHLKPADRYVVAKTPVNFATVVAAARGHGETAIGYRRWTQKDSAPTYGVVLNPPRHEHLTLAAEDSVIVVAEH